MSPDLNASDTKGEQAPVQHRHRLVFHRHPDWHGHCPLEEFELDGVTYTDVNHWRCGRWHFHLPFKHRHTSSGR